MVSAEVAALTGEVLKTMLLNKLKLTTAMLLVVFVLGAGGTSLAYRAHATEPADQKEDSEKPTAEKPTETPKQDQPEPMGAAGQPIQRPGDQPKSTERRRRNRTNRNPPRRRRRDIRR